MAAGIIYVATTVSPGVTKSIPFYVDDTASPTTFIPVSRLDPTGPGAGVAQASSTAGQLAAFLGAATVKDAPSYTDGLTNGVVADQKGNLFVIAGGMSVVTRSHVILAADGAQTDLALLTVSAGTKIVLTMASILINRGTSGNIHAVMGFGTANTPTPSKTGTNGIVLDGTWAAGDGQQRGTGSAVIGVGASNEDLRLTCDSPASGSLIATYSYLTMPS